MKANELRIGNYVLFIDEQYIEPEVKLVKISANDIQTHFEHQLFEPISLTEEWLLKFGFVWSIQHQAHYLYKFDYVIDICDGFCRVIKYRRNGDELISIKYVHQLQNLYFVLTNEELTMK